MDEAACLPQKMKNLKLPEVELADSATNFLRTFFGSSTGILRVSYGYSTGTIRRKSEKTRKKCGGNAEKTFVCHGKGKVKSAGF